MKSPIQLTPSTIGILGGAASAILYTITNICLRQVSDVEPTWVSTIKAIPTIFVVLPMVLLQAKATKANSQPGSNSHSPGSNLPLDSDRDNNQVNASGSRAQGTRRAFPRQELIWLVATSIVVQIFGNVGFQWALSILGLTISVPIVLATMLIGGAITGRLVLNEPVTNRRWVAVVVLIFATIVLSAGAGAQAQPVDPTRADASSTETTKSSGSAPANSVVMIVLGLAANIGSGVVYALQGTMMRRSMQRGMSASATLLVISVSGLAFLAGWSTLQFGSSVFELASAAQFKVMVMAGIFNALAFFAMAKSLQNVSVLYVQLLNASQAGISAAAGWLIFSESMNWPIIAGLVLTGVGLLFAGMRDAPASDIAKESSQGS